jgi:hypothetical protein
MNPEIHRRLVLLTENDQALSKEKKLKWNELRRAAAAAYALEDRRVDGEAIRASLKALQKSVGPLSSLRGYLALVLAANLSLAKDPQRALASTVATYELLRDAKFGGSDYLPLAAHMIAAHVEPDACAQAVERTRAFYDGMKANHPFLTGQDDLILAAMIGASGQDIAAAVDRVAELFDQLSDGFGSKSATQLVAQVLTLGQGGPDAAARAIELRQTLKAAKVRLHKGPTAPLLGVFALLDVAGETLAAETKEANRFLKEQKGFGALSMEASERLALAASIVARAEVASAPPGLVSAALASAVAAVMMQQQAAVVVIAAGAAIGASS